MNHIYNSPSKIEVDYDVNWNAMSEMQWVVNFVFLHLLLESTIEKSSRYF